MKRKALLRIRVLLNHDLYYLRTYVTELITLGEFSVKWIHFCGLKMKTSEVFYIDIYHLSIRFQTNWTKIILNCVRNIFTKESLFFKLL